MTTETSASKASAPGQTIGFIGAGNMASALIKGLLAGGVAPEHLLIADLDQEKTSALQKQFGLQVASDAQALASKADVVILAIKPGGLPGLLKSLRPQASGRLWISVAAGVTIATLEASLEAADARVIRAMPNTPALVGAGATGIVQGNRATTEDMALATELLSSAGLVVTIVESQMDALTGLSGSGPAYIMLAIEALADGAVRAGLPRPIAMKLAAQTVAGAGQLVLESQRHPAELKDAVTSPGGTTIAGVEALEARGFRGTLMAAVEAAAKRSAELAGK